MKIKTYYRIYYKHRVEKANFLFKLYLYIVVPFKYLINIPYLKKTINLDTFSEVNKSLFDKEMLPGPSASNDDDILNFARNSGGTVFHPSGTCRMGSDEISVVDPDLNVRGIGGLRIVDASIIPKMPSGNINASVMMIAEKAAEIILSNSAK